MAKFQSVALMQSDPPTQITKSNNLKMYYHHQKGLWMAFLTNIFLQSCGHLSLKRHHPMIGERNAVVEDQATANQAPSAMHPSIPLAQLSPSMPPPAPWQRHPALSTPVSLQTAAAPLPSAVLERREKGGKASQQSNDAKKGPKKLLIAREPRDAATFKKMRRESPLHELSPEEDSLLERAERGTSLGLAYSNLRAHQKALRHFEQALATYKLAYGDQAHADIASAHDHIGETLLSLNQANQALDHFQELLEIRKKLHGEAHADVAAAYKKLGIALSHLGHYKAALRCLYQGLQIYSNRSLNTSNHAHVAAVYDDIALILLKLGRYHDSLCYFKHGRLAIPETRRSNDADVASCYNNRGLALYKLRMYAQAREAWSEAVRLRRKIYRGGDTPCLAESLNNLGLSLLELSGEHENFYEEASVNFREALEIRKRLDIRPSVATATCHNNLAISLVGLGDRAKKEEACEHFKTALSIKQRVYGIHPHIELAVAHNNLGKVLSALEHYEESLTEYKNALSILKALPDSSATSYEVKRAHAGIARVRQAHQSVARS